MAFGLGSRGKDVANVQLQLKALGYDVGDIDGKFGPKTQAAVKSFQDDYESLAVTGTVDAETAAALAQALVIKRVEPPDEEAAPPGPVPCAPAVWSAFESLVDVVTSTPVRYGPGRGLFANGKWIITQGPGGTDRKNWTSHMGKTYPSFHCSSWTNFFLGWLLGYNGDYTHAGNIPSLFDLCEQSRDLHSQPEGASYRGYGPYCREIKTDGATRTRKHIAKVLDIRELYDRRTSLPTFIVCGQSTRTNGQWRWWHHTVLFVIDHRSPGSPMFRIAADGYHGADGRWSAKPMQYLAINEDTIPQFQENIIYRGYGVVSEDGTYGGNQSIASVTLES